MKPQKLQLYKAEKPVYPVLESLVVGEAYYETDTEFQIPPAPLNIRQKILEGTKTNNRTAAKSKVRKPPRRKPLNIKK